MKKLNKNFCSLKQTVETAARLSAVCYCGTYTGCSNVGDFHAYQWLTQQNA